MRGRCSLRIITMVAMEAMTEIAICAGQAVPMAEQNLTVYLVRDGAVPLTTLATAKMMAGEMFAGIGVRIEWRGSRPPASRALREGAIVVHMITDAVAAFGPGTMASAQPYERVHVTIFYDSMARVGGWMPSELQILLAHVLVHEITHMMHGSMGHTDSGIMKASWTSGDYTAMRRKPIPFSAEDVELIQLGMQWRADAECGRLRQDLQAGPVAGVGHVHGR